MAKTHLKEPNPSYEYEAVITHGISIFY